MSQLKFTQIQDMLILLSKKVTNLETAMKDLGAAVSEMGETVDTLEEKEKEREEKEKEEASTYAGKWKNGNTENDGEIVVMEVNTDTPTTANEDDDPTFGETTYTIKIKKIPDITLAAGDPINADYEFTPTDAVTFKGDSSKVVYADGVKATYNGTEITYTFTYVPADSAETFGKITLTAPTSTTFEADKTITFNLPEGGIVIENIPVVTSA